MLPGILRRTVQYNFNDISEEYIASIFRVEEYSGT
jgi:hypothetical protein